MKRFDAVRKITESPSSVVWEKNIGTAVFAAVLLVCSIAVGCSSDKPKAATTSQIPLTPPHIEESSPAMPATEVAKAAPKKVVKKRAAVRSYNDKTYGVSFVYPRKYGLESGDAANDLIAASPAPLISQQNGGLALAAIELPETAFPNTDFSSAFFGVSVNKALTAEQCGVPVGKNSAAENTTHAKASASSDTTQAASAPAPAVADASTPSTLSRPVTSDSAAASTTPKTETSSTESSALVEEGKLNFGDAPVLTKESVAGEGARQSDAKYYRTFQNGACYEFALNLTTIAKDEAGMKHVDRDKVFDRLEKILATVKIDAAKVEPVATAEVPAAEQAASTPAVASAQTPAQ